MNNPFDNQPSESPVVNLINQQQESSIQQLHEFSPDPDAGNDTVVPGVASSGGKKKLFILLGVVALLVVVGVAFFMLSSDGSSSSAPEPALAEQMVPLSPPSDMAAPVAPADPVAVAPSAPTAAPAASPCEQRMIDHAIQNGADPKTYVAQNQAYLEQCTQAMAAGAQ